MLNDQNDEQNYYIFVLLIKEFLQFSEPRDALCIFVMCTDLYSQGMLKANKLMAAFFCTSLPISRLCFTLLSRET